MLSGRRQAHNLYLTIEAPDQKEGESTFQTVTALAAFVPALRASPIDPVLALHTESLTANVRRASAGRRRA